MKQFNQLHPYLLYFAAFVLLPILLYLPAINGEFVYDDIAITVVENPALSGDATLWEILSWDRPLRELTYILDHSIWGYEPLGYHLQNLLWHIANVCLIFYFLRLLNIRWSISFFSTLLFAVHPIQTESVAWISGRKELLCLFFEVATCVWFIHALTKPTRFWRYYGLSLIALVLAMLSKQVAIMAPALMLISYMFYCHQHQSPYQWRLVLKYFVPVVLISLFFLILNYNIIEALNDVQDRGTFYDPAARDVSYTMVSSILTPLATLGKSVGLMVYPINLTVEHAFEPVQTLSDLRWIWGLVVLTVVCGMILISTQRWLLCFGALWFLLSWVPVSGAVPVGYLVAERYLYIPSIGFCLFLVTASHAIWVQLRGRLKPQEQLFQYTGYALIAVIILGLGYRTIDRNYDWRNEEQLWRSAIEIKPNFALLYFNLANVYAQQDRLDDATALWQKALERNPDLPQVWVNWGNALEDAGQTEQAEQAYRNALEVFPDYGMAHYNLALLLEKQGNIEAAIKHLEAATQNIYGRRNEKRRQGLAHYHLARVLYQQNQIEPAKAHIKRAVQLVNSISRIHILYGWLHQHEPNQAQPAFETAIQLAPQSAEPYYNFGLWYWHQGNINQTKDLWQQAVERDPAYRQSIINEIGIDILQ